LAQLSKAGIATGYGDGTYRGYQPITRYEVAQLVAKAMEKQNLPEAEKRALDKLSAEFAPELSSLGVRVAALEKKTDRVRWNGFLRFDAWKDKHGSRAKVWGGKPNKNLNHIQLEFDPYIRLNEHWAVINRMEFWIDSKASDNATMRVRRAWAEGKYGHTIIKLGRLPWDSTLDRGHIIGDSFSGAQVRFGNRWRTTLTAGRLNDYSHRWGGGVNDFVADMDTHDVQAIETEYDVSKALKVGVAYFHAKNDSWKDGVAYVPQWGPIFGYALKDGRKAGLDYAGPGFGADQRHIWEVGATYKFSPKLSFNVAYARNTTGNWERRYNTSYTAELTYNGGLYPNFFRKGSVGALLAYRQIGQGAVLQPTYNDFYFCSNGSMRGWNAAVAYVIAPKIMATLRYARGKDLMYSGDQKMSTFYGTLHFWFY